MKLLFNGVHEKIDQKEVQAAVEFYISELIEPALSKKLTLEIRFRKFDKKIKWAAETIVGIYPNQFRIELNSNYGKRSTLQMLAHEVVHVKQHLKKELDIFYDDQRNSVYCWNGIQHVKFSGEFPMREYYNSPWEIEAYGRQAGLYVMFMQFRKKR